MAKSKKKYLEKRHYIAGGLVIIVLVLELFWMNKDLTELSTKEVTLESVDKNEECYIFSCKSTKVIKFQEINQHFEIPDPQDTPENLKVILDQISSAGNKLEAQVYKLNDKECVHSVSIKGDSKKLLDYDKYYLNRHCYPDKESVWISLIKFLPFALLLIIV